MSEIAKEQAIDLNGAIAGEQEPDPELNTVDELASKAGVEEPEGKPLNLYETLKSRDENRLSQE